MQPYLELKEGSRLKWVLILGLALVTGVGLVETAHPGTITAVAVGIIKCVIYIWHCFGDIADSVSGFMRDMSGWYR